ncbi:LPS assembly protein LptD [Thalassococcus sp. CAU 1522]|uniref:LPS-assembly protein LptD n=1 Tax=Thalassococcus arenae TaxID=2851652 RepID=A0ABS6NBE2_9RHOB|nr:LPS assembly protein LptD [Thalassococcus arenae]MBV2361349.1 LPS assembly protein LptD [Thalassococcus arenae]
MRALILCVLLLVMTPPAVHAQDSSPALLVADSVTVESDSRLIATGNVEALHDGVHLSATRIVYDQSSDSVVIEGPIRLTDAEGTILLADQAQLDTRFRNGLLTGARMVLDQQLQLAATEARREGRYTQLRKVAVTSCQVCGSDGVPLWQIRASRVIHDRDERQLYFDDAQFRVLDVPVFWLPRLRLPDPTLKRAPGFLIPSIRSTTLLGTGLKLPYFVPIGDHQDITITPYLSPVTRTVELRYRRAFHNGDLTVDTTLSSDSLLPGEVRGLFFAEGAFDLRDGFKLTFDIETVSDNSYINDYGYAGGDRLDSALEVSRARRDDFIASSIVHYESLRETENNATQPTIIANARYEKRLFPSALAGELRIGGVVHGHFRYSDRDFDGDDDDTEVDGRDVARLNVDLSWRNRWTLMAGMRAGLTTHLWLDRYATRQDITSEADVSRATLGTALELRWPFERRGAQGGRTLVEPVLQYGWTGGERAGNPNDESTRIEFDEGNLLSLSRFPAQDRREHGQTLAAGLRWMHAAPQGWRAAMTVARIWREEADGDFTRSSGLEGEVSDWLIAGRFANDDGLSLTARGLIDDNARFSKAEARAAWSNTRVELGASYLLLVTDPEEDRDQAQSEWSFDGAYRFNRQWTGSTEWRYDLADQRLDRVGLGLQYRNECVEVGMGVSRRFASASNLEPSTDFDLTVALKGFGTGGSAKEYRRTCRN